MRAIDTTSVAASRLTYHSVKRARTDSKIVITHAFCGERVPSAAAGLDQLHFVTVVDLPAQALNVDLDQVRIGVEGAVPDVLANVTTSHDVALAADEVFQQRELLGGELNVSSRPRRA